MKMVQRLVRLVMLVVHLAYSFPLSFRETKSAMSLHVVIPDKSIENLLRSTEMGKALTSSKLKTLTTDTAYEGRTYVNRTATTLLERAKGLVSIIISPHKDVPLEKQLDTALGRESKSEG